ncbi:uncharacterized protein LOC128276586 [Anopheles cruzii]|uniref:uncharacterized protein LOC128276585 n=1 Tax=Anopheles cruzii TaxID=68878 RepID=UPI0022EC5F33|nr:uncharacterized protein LOC128276585 [Anopheles cruzii]XP_052871004.1 uncharacterized protein LOC128276586 [Anopheles cruzii]
MSWAQCMSNVGVLIMNNKLVTFLSVALFAFVITTIALSESNNTNAADLDECRAKLLSATTTTVATTTTLAPTTTVVNTTTLEPTTTTVAPAASG